MKNNFYKTLCTAALLIVAVGMASGKNMRMPGNSKDLYLWPVSGKVGTGLLYGPQCYIGKELNFSNLFITGKEGQEVYSPVDGVITFISMGYYESLDYSLAFRTKPASFDMMKNELMKDKGLVERYDKKFVTGGIGIRTAKGKQIYINGLSGGEVFKTGQKIAKGQVIGHMGYAFHKINKPCIWLSVSVNTYPADPMTPFGLKTTFVPPAKQKKITALSKEQALEDLNIYLNAFEEIYPDKEDIISAYQLDSLRRYYTSKIKSSKKDSIKSGTMRNIIADIVSLTHDSHLYLYPAVDMKNYIPDYQPQVYLSFSDDTVNVINTTKKYKDLYARRVVSINGFPVDTFKKVISAGIRDYDAAVKSYPRVRMFWYRFGSFCQKPYGNRNFDFHLKFANGDSCFVKGFKCSRRHPGPGLIKSWSQYFNINYYRGKTFSVKELNDSTAYLGLSSFTQSQVDLDSIGHYISSISGRKKYLIIDVRNNSGGIVEPLEQIFSYVAQDSLILNSFNKVNKRGFFKTMKYSMNYPGDKPLYENYIPYDSLSSEEKNIVKEFDSGMLEAPWNSSINRDSLIKSGFYNFSEGRHGPDSLVRYDGKIYVLTNENSISAATLFPALIVRSHRGVTVGRETRTAYHFMKAMKFAQMRLPNSQIRIEIPIMKSVFDTQINTRVPYGSGVLPDYPVRLTTSEMEFSGGDAILNRALELIKEGKYLKEDVFAKQTDRGSFFSETGKGTVLAAIIIIIMFVVAAVVKGKRKKETSDAD
ncbi:MAG: S41 family peptidase [Bacteroidales bacterium]|jgi:hypothetical protein|nr:S41 family peptidase [Bacteroidales bacterium]